MNARSEIEEFATTVAHELNQPLAAITAYVDGCLNRLKAGEPVTPAMIEALEQASAQAQRAGAVLRQIRSSALVAGNPLND